VVEAMALGKMKGSPLKYTQTATPNPSSE